MKEQYGERVFINVAYIVTPLYLFGSSMKKYCNKEATVYIVEEINGTDVYYLRFKDDRLNNNRISNVSYDVFSEYMIK